MLDLIIILTVLYFFQAHKLPTNKETGLERSSKSLNEKLATVLLDSHSGDDPLAKQAQKPQQEIRGILMLHFLSTFPTIMVLL